MKDRIIETLEPGEKTLVSQLGKRLRAIEGDSSRGEAVLAEDLRNARAGVRTLVRGMYVSGDYSLVDELERES